MASPAARAVPHVGTYRRELPVGLERLYENALDWEHLPWLHRSSFSRIACLEAGRWGWRARVGLQPAEPMQEVVIELRLDRDCRRWITRTIEGVGRGTEIWTHAFEVGERRTDIVVDFFVPDVPAPHVRAAGDAYAALYARLYDEDVWMMTERQRQLDRRQRQTGAAGRMALGSLQALRDKLPLRVDFQGHVFRVIQTERGLVAHSGVCPHLLGPLLEAPLEDGLITCPWHGYRYDVHTGENRSGQRCRLRPAPRVVVTGSGAQAEVALEAVG